MGTNKLANEEYGTRVKCTDYEVGHLHRGKEGTERGKWEPIGRYFCLNRVIIRTDGGLCLEMYATNTQQEKSKNVSRRFSSSSSHNIRLYFFFILYIHPFLRYSYDVHLHPPVSHQSFFFTTMTTQHPLVFSIATWQSSS